MRGTGRGDGGSAWIPAHLYAARQPPKLFAAGHQLVQSARQPQPCLFTTKHSPAPRRLGSDCLYRPLPPSCPKNLLLPVPTWLRAQGQVPAPAEAAHGPGQLAAAGCVAGGTAAAWWLLALQAGFFNLQGQCQCSCNISEMFEGTKLIRDSPARPPANFGCKMFTNSCCNIPEVQRKTLCEREKDLSMDFVQEFHEQSQELVQIFPFPALG